MAAFRQVPPAGRPAIARASPSWSPARSAAAVFAIAALLSLLLLVRVPGNTAWLRAALDTSHGPIFAAIAFLVVTLIKPGVRPSAWPHWRRCGTALALSVALGALIEFLQSFQNRPPSLGDVVTDMAGALAGLAVWALASRPRLEGRRVTTTAVRTVVALGLIGAAFILWRPLQAAKAYAHRASAFPVIAEFRDSTDLYFVGGVAAKVEIVDMPRQWARAPAERTLAVLYDRDHSRGVVWIEPSPDWRGHSIIAIDITNPTPTEMTLGVLALDQDGYWSRLGAPAIPITIAPGARMTARVALDAVSRAPDERPTDLARIVTVRLVSAGPPVPPEFYVSRIWLE